MTQSIYSTEMQVLVAIDIAKASHDVLIQWPDVRNRKFKVANLITPRCTIGNTQSSFEDSTKKSTTTIITKDAHYRRKLS